MIVEQSKVVGVSYILMENAQNGNLIEEIPTDAPFHFLFGSGRLLERFEANLKGLKTGDSFAFTLNEEEGYGKIRPELVVPLPLNMFMVDGNLIEQELFIGNVLSVEDENGNILDGEIKAIEAEQVIMDFNHPLAGKGLFFKGKVEEVRAATETEIAHGHVHQDGHDCGHHHH